MIIQILRSKEVCAKYDLSSVRFVYCGAAPLGEETIKEVNDIYPDWTIAQAYGEIALSNCGILRLIVNRNDGNCNSRYVFERG
jgi:acyl-coenzyme A synthetase/AMP-(fatty) acid ligase